MPGMPESIALVEELRLVASELSEPLRTRAYNVLDEYTNAQMHPGFLLGEIQELRERIDQLYDDISYDRNPTRDIWEFGLLLHQGLCEDDRKHLQCCRRRMRELLLRCLSSWSDKEDWEKDVEMMLREQEQGGNEESHVLTA